MVQSKFVIVEKGNIVENKPSTKVRKSIFDVEKRYSYAARENLFHINMQSKNTMVASLLYYDSENNFIFVSWMQ